MWGSSGNTWAERAGPLRPAAAPAGNRGDGACVALPSAQLKPLTQCACSCSYRSIGLPQAHARTVPQPCRQWPSHFPPAPPLIPQHHNSGQSGEASSTRTDCGSCRRKRKRRSTMTSATAASVMANWSPMHLRAPPPAKGRQGMKGLRLGSCCAGSRMPSLPGSSYISSHRLTEWQEGKVGGDLVGVEAGALGVGVVPRPLAAKARVLKPLCENGGWSERTVCNVRSSGQGETRGTGSKARVPTPLCSWCEEVMAARRRQGVSETCSQRQWQACR